MQKNKRCEMCDGPMRRQRKRFCSIACYRSASPLERFRSKFVENKSTGCWEWKAGLLKDGYGGFAVFDQNSQRIRSMGAHRFSWMIQYGDIPTGFFVCHHCDNRLCVNPGHLFLGTPKDNNRDMMEKGRQYFPLGEEASNAKLSTQQVIEIRNRHATEVITQRQLAIEYGIGFKGINKIIKRQRWKHV